MSPDIVGCGGVDVAELGELFKEPLFALCDGRFGLRSLVFAVEKTGQRQGRCATAKGEVGFRDRSVNIETFGSCRPAPGAVFVLLSDQVINPSFD